MATRMPDPGEGDEYELGGDIELVHSDPKVLKWRAERFASLGFSKGESESLARWRSAEVHDVARWLEQGCTHAQALQIVAPVVAVPTEAEVREFGEQKALPPGEKAA